MIPRPRSLRVVAAGVVCLQASARSLLAQCAMCGSAASSSPGVARGLAYSIFFLLGALALTVGWLILVVLRSQARSARGAAGAYAPAGGAPSIPDSQPPAGQTPAGT